jgi:hypothetical protein
MDLQRGSALERGAKSLGPKSLGPKSLGPKSLGLKSLGLKSLWCHVAVLCRYGEHWSNVGWLP